MKPVVDILLATHNGAPFLKEQLDSIFNQSYPYFKIFIRDDQSQDTTVELLKLYQEKHPDRLFFTVNSKREGVLNNFWNLIQSSENSFVMFSDQDDVWLPEKIELSLREILKHDQNIPLLVHTDLQVVNEALEQLSPSFWQFAKMDPIKGKALSRLLVQNTVTGCTCLINRSLIDRLPKIPPKAMMHDWWIALVATTFGQILTISEAPILYRQHQKNVLGVNKTSLFSQLKKGYRIMLKSNHWKVEAEKKYTQAADFLRIYEKQLNQSQLALLLSVAQTAQVHWLQRKFDYFKYKLFWHGLLRNLLRFPLYYPY